MKIRLSASGIIIAVLSLLLIAMILTPNLMRTRFVHKDLEGTRQLQMATGLAADDSPKNKASANERKIIYTAALDLVVGDVRAVAAHIEAITVAASGFVETSEFSEDSDGLRSAAVTIRVPAGQLADIRNEIKKLAERVNVDKSEARDVTREFVDSEARLRNLKATEAQYLQLMRRAGSVKDMVEVTDKLSDVRGEIEQLQAELQHLSHQVEMAAITINLRTSSGAAVGAVNWQPLRQARLAFRDLRQGLADYADTMVAIILMLPVILLWAATLGLAAFVVWKIGRRVWVRMKRGTNG